MGDLKRQNKQKSKAPAPPPQEEETEIGKPRFFSPEKDIALVTLEQFPFPAKKIEARLFPFPLLGVEERELWTFVCSAF